MTIAEILRAADRRAAKRLHPRATLMRGTQVTGPRKRHLLGCLGLGPDPDARLSRQRHQPHHTARAA
jgi:hypothetical protein